MSTGAPVTDPADRSSRLPATSPEWRWHAAVALSVIAWWALYRQLLPLAEWLTALVPVDRHDVGGGHGDPHEDPVHVDLERPDVDRVERRGRDGGEDRH